MVAPALVSAPPGDVSGRCAALALGVLVLVGFGVRLWLMQESIAAGAFAPTDPDNYRRHGRELAQDGAGRVAAGRANYGVTHRSITDVNDPTSAHGSLGVTVLVRSDLLRVRITPQSGVSMARPLRISMRIDGRPAAGRLIPSPDPLELRYPWPRGLAYVEVTVTDPGGNPVAFSFEIPEDRPMKL